MPKINQEEYEVLKGLDDKWKWIARDGDGGVWVYKCKPSKREETWHAGVFMGLNDYILQFIQWEDESPYNIAELVEEYEREAHIKQVLEFYEEGFRNVRETFIKLRKAFSDESEETEVKKDKEWLKEAMLALKNKGNPENNQTEKERELGRAQQWAWNNCVDRAYELAKQLDEPEVLSSDWINEHGRLGHFQHGGGIHFDYFVNVKDLQNLLVPKQEEMKVSKTWHDVIAQNKEEGHSLRWTLNYIDNLNVNDVDDFAKAWLAYPNIAVEEEQKYQVKDSHGRTLLAKMTYSHKGKTFEKVQPYNEVIVGYKKELTEQEIKDYDERYWPFAVKVEELEE